MNLSHMGTLSQSLMAGRMKYADYHLGFIQLLPLELGWEGWFPRGKSGAVTRRMGGVGREDKCR